MILVQVPVPLRAVHGLFAEVGPLTKCLGSAFPSGFFRLAVISFCELATYLNSWVFFFFFFNVVWL